jgi:hypothetical protein
MKDHPAADESDARDKSLHDPAGGGQIACGLPNLESDVGEKCGAKRNQRMRP